MQASKIPQWKPLSPMISVFIRQEEKTWKREGHIKMETGSDAATSKECLKLPEAREGRRPHLSLGREHSPADS